MSPVNRKLSRRDLLGAFGAAGAGFTIGCASSPASPTASASTTGTTTTTAGGTSTTSSCAIAAEETAGPYPDRIGMISNQSFFRQDITEGKSGLPLTLALTIVNVSKTCAPVANASVEIWQCDASGNYSEYAQPGYNGTGQTFLRGLQTTDSSGRATFRTIYPGWYAGRATHIHVQVFINGAVIKTTQIAFPEDVTSSVYRTGVYAAHGQSTTSNTSDNVFSDGTSSEMAALTGDTGGGYTATLTVGVSA
jgi:protocatechuate 3,4-dioxygenase beta subunit